MTPIADSDNTLTQGLKNKYYAYVRMSGWAWQRSRNLSIPSQTDQINQYIQSQDTIEIVHFYEEVHSAYKGDRPKFQEMLRDLKKNKHIKGIIVMKWDRISRNPDDYLKLQRVRGDQYQVDVISVTEPMIGSYLGRYMIRDLQNRSILYSEELSFRVKIGQRKKMQMGGYCGKPPFWYTKQSGYLIPDINQQKADIVVFIFKTYGEWKYGVKEVAKLVRNEFKLKSFCWRSVEKILKNSSYYGIYNKKWILGNDDYMFFGAKEPGIYEEFFELKYIQPLIDKELFDQCQIIRIGRSPYKNKRTWTSKFPKIFQCSCGRKLCRENKKWKYRYLICQKQKNSVFPNDCYERTTDLTFIDSKVEGIIRSMLPTSSVRNEMVAYIENDIKSFSLNKNQRLSETLQQIDTLNTKLKIMTQNFTNGQINNDVFVIASEEISKSIDRLKNEIKWLENQQEYIVASKKTIDFIQLLEFYGSILDFKDDPLWSSRLYSIFFHIIPNSIISNRDISSYMVFEPFKFWLVLEKCVWQGVRGSNPWQRFGVS